MVVEVLKVPRFATVSDIQASGLMPRRFSGDVWYAGPNSRDREQEPGPAATPAEAGSLDSCLASAFG